MKHYNFGLIYVSVFFIYKIIESREMKDESKDPDTIDGAVRVAQLVNPSSFKETLGFLIIFVISVEKCSFSVRFLRLAIILISSCIMFRTWLILLDQSGLHRLELSVSHSTFALICN